MTISDARKPQRDSDYYFPDGNVVLRVGDTLFRVHKSILSKDSSVFKDMFSIPQPEPSDSSRCCDGDTDESPIQLSDTAKEFRTLLWSLYALPAELFRTNDNPSILEFADIACMAHKYQFSTTEEWAIGRLNHSIGSLSDEGVTMNDVTINEAKELTRVAVLCKLNSPKLYDAVIHNVWKNAIAKGTNLSTVINIIEEYGLKEIEGLAYYNMMLKGRDAWKAQIPVLSREQRIRLLNGHYTLLVLSKGIPNNPPTFTHSPACTYNVKCGENWHILWKKITTKEVSDSIIATGISQPEEWKPEPHDYLQHLVVVYNIMQATVGTSLKSSLSQTNIMPEGCLEEAAKETGRKVEETRLKLAEYFVDLE